MMQRMETVTNQCDYPDSSHAGYQPVLNGYGGCARTLHCGARIGGFRGMKPRCFLAVWFAEASLQNFRPFSGGTVPSYV
jgi:hypothetical protein